MAYFMKAGFFPHEIDALCDITNMFAGFWVLVFFFFFFGGGGVWGGRVFLK
jgi:hypothetical protein